MYSGLVMYGVLSYYRRQWSFQCMRGEAEWMRTRLGMWWSFKPVLSWGSRRGLAQNSTEWVCPSLISTFSCSLTFYIDQEPKPCKRLAGYFPIAQAVIRHEYIMSLLPWEPKQNPQILFKIRLRQAAIPVKWNIFAILDVNDEELRGQIFFYQKERTLTHI